MSESTEVCDIAERILRDVLHDVEIRHLIEAMLADDSITKEQLYHTAFVQGVLSAVAALQEGRLINLSSNRSQHQM